METPQEKVATLPHTPGVYLYRDGNGGVLYVGKAKDLKKRVSQYFQRDDAVGQKTKLLVSQIATIDTVETASEFDALLLEATLIHTYSPKYNAVLKDDKSPLYVLITFSEALPHVTTLRRSDIPKTLHRRDRLYGPFQSARVIRTLLRELRHVIPYCTQKIRNGKPCFYTHSGLCNPCPSTLTSAADKRCYRQNIRRLSDIFSGKSTKVLNQLKRDMNACARQHRFEEAATLRNSIQNLYAILSRHYDPTVYLAGDVSAQDLISRELSDLEQALNIHPLTRIECIDISNIGGTYATGSLVVLTHGRSDPGQYRRFRIRRKNVPNDVAMIQEVVTRRFSHSEWPRPNLLVIDGGKGQVQAAKSAPVTVIGLAKRYEELIIPLPDGTWKTLRLDLTSPALNVVKRIRDEAHRFALSYHRLLRKKAFGTIKQR